MNRQEQITASSFPLLTEEELAELRGQSGDFTHGELRELARENLSAQLNARRNAALDLLQAFIDRVASKPSPKVSSAEMIERIEADEPHRFAALRKTN